MDVQTHIRRFSEIDGFPIGRNDLIRLILGVDLRGICGAAPAGIARFLAEPGIDSISVNAATLFRTMSVAYETEQAFGAPRAAD